VFEATWLAVLAAFVSGPEIAHTRIPGGSMNVSGKSLVRLSVVAAALAAGAVPAFSDLIFTFNSDTAGTSTPFSNTVRGLTATFSSPADPGAFFVGTPAPFAPPFNGNSLSDWRRASRSNIALDVTFNSNLSSVSVDFVTRGSGPFDLSLYEGPLYEGHVLVTETGSVPAGFNFPQGVIGFHFPPFDELVLTAPSIDTPYFAIDNLDAVPIPEPISLPLLLTLLAVVAVPLHGKFKASC
jgi:hypothetical protein